MELIKLVVSGGLLICLAIASCKSTSTEKKAWTQEERTKYMSDCISNAKKSYEEKGVEPDKELITKICKCTGEKIEAKYGYMESSRLPEQEKKAFIVDAIQKCATAK